MTRFVLDLTLADADRLVVALDKLDGYPSRGAHVGGGRHVATPRNWDGIGSAPPGWTKGHASVQKPDLTAYRVSLPQETQDRRSDSTRRARLTATELAQIDGLVLADTLPPGWVDTPLSPLVR